MAAAAVRHANVKKAKRAEEKERRTIAMSMLERFSSRGFSFRVSTKITDENGERLDNLETKKPVAETKERDLGIFQWRKYQPEAEWLYQNIYVQVTVALLIIGNFIVNIVETQVGKNGYAKDQDEAREKGFTYRDGQGGISYMKRGKDSHLTQTMMVFIGFEEFFFWAFLLELWLNMYSCATGKLSTFWGSGWNKFDFFIVFITVMFKCNLPLPAALGYLRLLRAFRVFRLFKRVKSLNKIIVSLGKAMPGVSNAFLILTIVMCIYAILGVELFGQLPCGILASDGPNSCVGLNSYQQANRDRVWEQAKADNNWDDADRANWKPPRHYAFTYGNYDDDADEPPTRMCSRESAPGYGMIRPCRIQYGFGQEYFGNFFKALYTLFQVLTGESWSEAIARPLLEWSPWATAVYFVSFILINGIVLINVVVAVLLEKMVDDEPEEEEEEEADGAPAEHHAHHHEHHKHPSVAQIYAERKEERKTTDAKLAAMEKKLAVLVAILDKDGSASAAHEAMASGTVVSDIY